MEGRLSGPRRILLVASFMYMILSSLSESFSSGRGILNNKKQHHPWLTGGATVSACLEVKMKQFTCRCLEVVVFCFFLKEQH